MSLSNAMSTLAGAPRRIARFFRHLPDRLLHRRRRRRLMERLRDRPPPRSALFVCLGNINRSALGAAMFEAALASRGRDGVRVRSAGFIGPGRPASAQARTAAAARGLDLEGHVSRALDSDEVRGTDLVVVMDAHQRRKLCAQTGRPASEVVILGDLDPAPIVRRVIQDPYGHSEDVYRRVFDRVERCTDSLADAAAGPPVPDTP